MTASRRAISPACTPRGLRADRRRMQIGWPTAHRAEQTHQTPSRTVRFVRATRRRSEALYGLAVVKHGTQPRPMRSSYMDGVGATRPTLPALDLARTGRARPDRSAMDLAWIIATAPNVELRVPSEGAARRTRRSTHQRHERNGARHACCGLCRGGPDGSRGVDGRTGFEDCDGERRTGARRRNTVAPRTLRSKRANGGHVDG